jgi:4-hydroxy-4-methyl-2-oxoglutarate aldolase
VKNNTLTKLLQRLGPMPTPFPVYGTAFLSDAMHKLGINKRVLDPAIRPLIPFTRLVGVAVTIKLEPARNDDDSGLSSITECYALAYESARQVCSPVLVIESPFTAYGAVGSGSVHVAMNQYGFVGGVVEGVLRDTDEIAKMNFPVYYRYITPEHIDHIARGASANQPVTAGGVRISPGDIIVGDNDGVIVLQQEEVPRVMEVADEIMSIEEKILREIDGGTSYQEAGDKYFTDLLRKVER